MSQHRRRKNSFVPLLGQVLNRVLVSCCLCLLPLPIAKVLTKICLSGPKANDVGYLGVDLQHMRAVLSGCDRITGCTNCPKGWRLQSPVCAAERWQSDLQRTKWPPSKNRRYSTVEQPSVAGRALHSSRAAVLLESIPRTCPSC